MKYTLEEVKQLNSRMDENIVYRLTNHDTGEVRECNKLVTLLRSFMKDFGFYLRIR